MRAPLHHPVRPLAQNLVCLEQFVEIFEGLLRPLRKFLIQSDLADHSRDELESFFIEDSAFLLTFVVV